MISFIKMQGLGNDFIVLDAMGPARPETAGILRQLNNNNVKKWCDRRLGIGADQVLVLVSPTHASALARMEVWNADGSRSEMCGNGLRAVGRYLAQKNALGSQEFTLETAAGVHRVRVAEDHVAVEMGIPQVGALETLDFAGHQLNVRRVGMGNPHVVIGLNHALSNLGSGAELARTLGPGIEVHPSFLPARTNVEFVEIRGPNILRVDVWERGAGITQACGSGACAALAAFAVSGQVDRRAPVRVELPGGVLELHWPKDSESLWMSGPAATVFTGQIAPFY